MFRFGVVLGVVFAAVTDEACADRPVAFIFQVKGDVQILSDDGMSRKAAMFGGVYAAEKLVVAEAGTVSLRFAVDGHRELVAKAGEWDLSAAGLQPQSGVQILASGNDRGKALGDLMRSLPEAPKVGGRLGGVTVARSGDHEGPAVTPLDAEVVLGNEIEFSWPARKGVKQYRVFVNSNGRKVWSESTTATHSSLPPASLQPGMRYDWQVVDARPGGGTIVKSSFTAAFPSQQEQARLLQEVAKEGPEARAFAALTAESQRFYSLALSLYEELAKDSDEPTFHAALVELYGRSGQMEAAQRERRKAEELGFVFSKPAVEDAKP